MYDALIVLNGEIPAPNLWQHLAYGTLIATDGAAPLLTNFNIVPDTIIGDMDSIADDPLNASNQALQNRFIRSQVLKVLDQNTTDFEKALNFVVQQNFKTVLCLGLLGKAADHTIYNLSLLSRYSDQLELMAFHHYENASQWIFPLMQGKTSIYTQMNAIISLFPLTPAKIHTQGLKWELNGTIYPDKGIATVRNGTQRENITVQCTGKVLCFISTPEAPKLVFDQI